MGGEASFKVDVQADIKRDLICYRHKLQGELGRSTVGSVALTSGFSVSLIDLVSKHLPELTSVEKVEEILPVYSREIAGKIFDIIQQHIA